MRLLQLLYAICRQEGCTFCPICNDIQAVFLDLFVIGPTSQNANVDSINFADLHHPIHLPTLLLGIGIVRECLLLKYYWKICAWCVKINVFNASNTMRHFAVELSSSMTQWWDIHTVIGGKCGGKTHMFKVIVLMHIRLCMILLA